MATKSVRIDTKLYERIKAHKRDDETFSEAIERLIGDEGVSLLDLADGDGYTPEREEEMLTRLERTADADERALDGQEAQRDP